MHRARAAAAACFAACFALAGAARAGRGGPDELGYAWTDAEDGCPADFPTFTPASQVWNDPLAAIGPLPLGFVMPFAGGAATQAFVSPSGFLAFSNQGPAGASDVPQLMPDATPPNHLVAPFWKPYPAPQVEAEAFPDRFVVAWKWDEGAPFLTPEWVTLFRDGSVQVNWAAGRFGAADATVGYEDGTGAAGTTYWHQGVAIEPGFGRVQSGGSLCLLPPALLDCATPVVVACGSDVRVDLPASAPRQAFVYACAPATYDGNERVVRLDLSAPRGVSVSIDSPAMDLLQVRAPPQCAETGCIRYDDAVLDLPVAFAGTHWFVVDQVMPGGGSTSLQVACTDLRSVSCGGVVAGTTAGAPALTDTYACAGVTLDGGETHFLLSRASPGHVATRLAGATPGAWVVIRDATAACLAADIGGATAFGVPAGDLVLTVDGPAGSEGAFTLEVECGTRLDCAVAGAAACESTVRGDTASAGASRVTRYACGSALQDGAEEVLRFTNPREQVVDVRWVSAQPGQAAFVLDACDEARCRFGGDDSNCATLPAGDYLLVVDGPAGFEGPWELLLECHGDPPAGADLRPVRLDAAALATDCRDLDVAGTLRVSIENEGAADVTTPYRVVAFLDADGAGDLDPGDTVVGSTTTGAPVPGGAQVDVDVAVSATLPFREAPIHVKVDADATVPQLERGDDVIATSWSCAAGTPGQAIVLREEWAWTSPRVQPASIEVENLPLVGDLDGDGVPEILFTSQECCTGFTETILRAVSGRDGSDVFTADAPASRFRVATQQALGDVDGDGSPDVVGQSAGSPDRLICLDATGALKWTSVPLPVRSVFDTYSGGPAIADLDGDGDAEVIWGPNALDGRTGGLFWTPESGGTLGGSDGGPLSVVVDVDGDGDQEVIAGPTAYTWERATQRGRILWRNPDVPDGYAAAGNLDDDPFVEIAIGEHYRLHVLAGESGALQWEADLPTGGGATCGGFSSLAGGPPTLADVDADGRLEILIVAADWLACYEGDGTLRWRAPISECSSGTTSATAFDLDGDGRVEIVHEDEVAVRVLRGDDGGEIVSLPHTSGTAREMPVVADVDADGQAEIVVIDNRLLGGSGVGQHGVRVLGSGAAPWVGARPTWNQHAYHVTNVQDDLTVAAPTDVGCRPPSPLSFEGFRIQQGVPRPGPLGSNLTLTLLSAERLGRTGCSQELRLRLRAGNAGAATSGATTAAFHDGDPLTGGALLLTLPVPALRPGAFADIEAVVSASVAAPIEVWAVVDDDGTGAGVVAECDETDNACIVTGADVGGVPAGVPRDVGAALRATAHGDPQAADVTATFEWSRDAGAPRVLGTSPGEEHDHLRRGELGIGAPLLALVAAGEPLLSAATTESTPRTLDPDLPHVWGYLVLAAGACEDESLD
jgi:hypothetical protein